MLSFLSCSLHECFSHFGECEGAVFFITGVNCFMIRFIWGRIIIAHVPGVLQWGILTGLNAILCGASWQVIATSDPVLECHYFGRKSFISKVSILSGSLIVRSCNGQFINQKLTAKEKLVKQNYTVFIYSHCWMAYFDIFGSCDLQNGCHVSI